jgi:hypothetical protein
MNEQDLTDFEKEIVGCLHKVPDKTYWRFEVPDRTWHPGVCYNFSAETQEVELLKGTSQQPAFKYGNTFFPVEADDSNGLNGRTYFCLRSRTPFRSRKIQLLHHDALLGRLKPAQLTALQQEMRRLYGNPAE